jgi:hypothetical protein
MMRLGAFVVASWLMLGCDGGNSVDADNGLEALLRVKGGQYYSGALDKVSSADAPAVIDIINSQAVVTPGLHNKPVSGRLAPGTTAVALGLASDTGYWILPADVPDSDSPSQPTFHATLSFSPTLPARPYDLLVRAVAPPDLMGPAAHSALDARAVLPPTGSLVISLWWDTLADLDLHVVDPWGTEIWAGNINSFDRYATTPTTDAGAWNEGGILDFDSNAGCVLDGRCGENVVYTAAPPWGTYVVRVDTFSLCGNSAARWTVEALLDGVSLGRAEGIALPSEQRFSKGQGSGLGALSFTLAPP